MAGEDSPEEGVERICRAHGKYSLILCVPCFLTRPEVGNTGVEPVSPR